MTKKVLVTVLLKLRSTDPPLGTFNIKKYLIPSLGSGYCEKTKIPNKQINIITVFDITCDWSLEIIK